MLAKDLLSQQYPRIEAESTLAQAFGIMAKTNELCAAVFKEGKYIGILSHRGFLKPHVVYSYTKAENFIDKFAPRLNPEDDLLRIAELMYQSGLRMLPVFQNSELKGFVHVRDVLSAAFDELDIGSLKLADIASEPIVLQASDTLGKALALMKEHNVKQLPIVDKNKKFVGILTLEGLVSNYFIHAAPKRELFSLKGHEPEAKAILELPVSGLLEEANTASPSTSLAEVKQLICETKSIVVLANNVPKGIVTTGDVLAAIVKPKTFKRNIQLSNAPEFTEPDKKRVMRTLNAFYDKAAKILHTEDLMLLIHFKSHEKEGMRKKHSVHAKLDAPGFSANAKGHSWNYLTALQDALEALMKEIIKHHDKTRR